MADRRKLKIVHITDIYGDGGGGATLTVDSLCSLLEERGHQNSILYGTKSGPSFTKERQTLMIEGLCEYQPLAKKGVINLVGKFLQQEEPDLVQIHQTANPTLVSFLARHYPSVLYVYNHMLSCPSGSRLYATTNQICPITISLNCIPNHYLKRCGTRRPIKVTSSYLRGSQINHAAKNVTSLIAISQYIRDTMVTAEYSSSKIRVIHSLSPISMSKTTQTTSCTSNSNTLLFAGRITEIKGLEVLINCLPLLKQDWRLVVVGEGYRLPDAVALTAKLGLQNRVEFKQWVAHEEMKELYQQASVVIVPSIYPEPLGLVGVEAMYYSRPAVAFDVGGISEWLEDGYNGFLCRHPDIEDMAAKIDRLLGDKDLAARMGANGKLKLQAEFNPDDIADSFVNCYEEAIKDFNASKLISTN